MKNFISQASLAKWLRATIIGVGVCALAIYAATPTAVHLAVDAAGGGSDEIQRCFLPWVGLIWSTGIPVFPALIFAWQIAANIGCDCSFSYDNAVYLKRIAILAAGDAVFFFLGNAAFLIVNISHPSVAIVSLVIVFLCVAVAVAAAVLSYLVTKAAELQEQSDLTI